jgi:hypothetical protein
MGKLEEKKLFSSDQICIWNYQALLSENLRVQFPPIFQNYPISESEQNIYEYKLVLKGLMTKRPGEQYRPNVSLLAL